MRTCLGRMCRKATFADKELSRVDGIAPPGEVTVPLHKADFGLGRFR